MKYAAQSLFLDDSYKEILTQQDVETICANDDARYLFELFGYDAIPDIGPS